MTTPATKPLRQFTTPRRGVSRLEAAVFVGVSVNRFNGLVRDGRMPPPRNIDGVQVWDVYELGVYFDALPYDDPAGHGRYLDDA